MEGERQKGKKGVFCSYLTGGLHYPQLQKFSSSKI